MRNKKNFNMQYEFFGGKNFLWQKKFCLMKMRVVHLVAA